MTSQGDGVAFILVQRPQCILKKKRLLLTSRGIFMIILYCTSTEKAKIYKFFGAHITDDPTSTPITICLANKPCSNFTSCRIWREQISPFHPHCFLQGDSKECSNQSSHCLIWNLYCFWTQYTILDFWNRWKDHNVSKATRIVDDLPQPHTWTLYPPAIWQNLQQHQFYNHKDFATAPLPEIPNQLLPPHIHLDSSRPLGKRLYPPKTHSSPVNAHLYFKCCRGTKDSLQLTIVCTSSIHLLLWHPFIYLMSTQILCYIWLQYLS